MNGQTIKAAEFHETFCAPMMLLVFVAYWYQFSDGKEPWIWGITFSFIGLLVFLKAKIINHRQRTNMFQFSWIAMLVGYLLSFYS